MHTSILIPDVEFANLSPLWDYEMLKIKCFKVVLIFTFLGFSAVPYTQYVLNKPVSNSMIELDMVYTASGLSNN